MRVLLWLAAFAAAGYILGHAWVWFDNSSDWPDGRKRADGNSGHTQIDFGGQWVMARMLVTGHGRELYHRQRQWEIVRAGFPVADEMPINRLNGNLDPSVPRIGLPPDELGHDADHLMNWFMGRDPTEWRIVGGAAALPLGADPFGNPFLTAALSGVSADVVTPAVVAEVAKPAIGGPLYPPVHAFFYAPLGLIDRPQVAYRFFQVFAVAVVFLAGLGVKVLSRRRIPWPVAVLCLFMFPGTRGGLDLGQNPTLSLTIVIWGWALASRGYAVGGGAVWGLFAFKPVWALAFFLVPLLTRRWRFAGAMMLTGAAIGAATLPFVGLQAWFDWLEVGKEAAALYNVNKNWINLSRDLQGIPRRILHDFSLPEAQRDTALAKALAWSLWGVVFASTVAVYLRFGDRRRATGAGVAFLFLGAYLTCYRFMYYDALLAAMGCAVLFADPARFLRTRVFGLVPVEHPAPLPEERVLATLSPSSSLIGPRLLGCVNSFPLTVFALLLFHENSLAGLDLKATVGVGYWGGATTGSDGATGRTTPRVEFDTSVNYPWETGMVLVLWAWCAWRLIRGEERRPPR